MALRRSLVRIQSPRHQGTFIHTINVPCLSLKTCSLVGPPIAAIWNSPKARRSSPRPSGNNKGSGIAVVFPIALRQDTLARTKANYASTSVFIVANEIAVMRQLQRLLQLAALFDSVKDALVWVKDRDGRYCWVNRAFQINYTMDRPRRETHAGS